MKKLVILDFDGTIYRGDSLLHFARYLNPLKYYASMLIIAFPFVFSKLGFLPVGRVKELFFRMHLRGLSQQKLQERGSAFFGKYQLNLFPKAIEYILKEQESESRCIVVSASSEEWLKPFCDFLEMELICTQLEYNHDGKCTGKLQGENVKGKGKITALKQVVDLAHYDEIVSFGNSAEDRILATISHQYYHRFFE